MKPPTRPTNSVVKIFAIPLVLAALSLFGLISALLGNGLYDILAWLTLAAPTVVILACVLRQR